METRATRNKRRCIRPSSQKSKKKDDKGLRIDDLPQEMFMKILGYLDYDDLCRAGRVCKKWHTATRSPFFWTRVDARIIVQNSSNARARVKIIDVLPEYITHLRLNFEHLRDADINLKTLMRKIQIKVPNLQVLVFYCAEAYEEFELFEEEMEVFSSIRAVGIHYCTAEANIFQTSPIGFVAENRLDLLPGNHLSLIVENMYSLFSSGEYNRCYPYNFLRKLPNLEKLCLAKSNFCDYIFPVSPNVLSNIRVLDLEGATNCSKSFKTIWSHGQNLVELYICFTSVSDDELVFTDNLPSLKTVCLRTTSVTCEGITLLLNFCSTLEDVSVGNHLFNPSYDYADCNSKKVKVVQGTGYCKHFEKNNYMHD